VQLSVGGLPLGMYNGTPYFNPPTITPGATTKSSTITLEPSGTTDAKGYDIKVSGLDQCGSGAASVNAEKDITLTTTGGTGPNNPSTLKLQGILPLCVPTGGDLVLHGSGFTGQTTVTIGGQSVEVDYDTSRQITIRDIPPTVLPSGVASILLNVTVTNPGGGSVSLANAVTVGACNSQHTQDLNLQNQPGSATPCSAASVGQAGQEVAYVIVITWRESLVIPWITSALTLTANQRAFCQ
jgi:hypothetical protein